MKFLILITISILSLNVFSAELGEDQKGQCPFLDQSSKRNAKVVESAEVEVVKEATKVISK
jgi:hypothetical protein